VFEFSERQQARTVITEQEEFFDESDDEDDFEFFCRKKARTAITESSGFNVNFVAEEELVEEPNFLRES
jgi:hypothetical protein